MNRPTSSVAVGVMALLILAGCNSGMNSGSPAPSTPVHPPCRSAVAS